MAHVWHLRYVKLESTKTAGKTKKIGTIRIGSDKFQSNVSIPTPKSPFVYKQNFLVHIIYQNQNIFFEHKQFTLKINDIRYKKNILMNFDHQSKFSFWISNLKFES